MLRSFRAACVLISVWLSLTCVASRAQAGKVKVWAHQAAADFEKAKFKGAVVTSEGALRLSRELASFAHLDATHVWDVVEDTHGNLFAATGDEGKIYRIDAAGKVSVAYAGDETEILCLALAADGSLYAGTGPHGRIIRVQPDGTTGVFYQGTERYVWSLAIDPRSGTLYAGTGPQGRILAVTPEGKGRTFYTTRQDHVLSVATGPDGTLYAGTDKHGLVYRVDARGKGFVLYSAPQGEVRRLLVTADGIYAATSSPARSHLALGSPDRTTNSGSFSGSPTSLAKTDTTRTATATGRHLGSSLHEDNTTRTSPAAGPPTVGENSLYRIGHDGTVREIFREKALLLGLLRQDGRILIGTGMSGQLFEVEEATKERSEVARLDHGQIHCLCRRRDGSVILGTGDPGQLYILRDAFTRQGTVTSDVLDARMISRWGALRWKADTPAGTAVSVAVRTGNLAEPDDTWSDWSEEQTDPAAAAVTAPTARFLQYRVTLTRTAEAAASPALHGLTIRYMTANQAPEVTSVEVPDLDAAVTEHPKKLKIRWSASDPNDDELTYSLYVRKDGWKHWVKLRDDLDKKDYEWDTTTTPSGSYRVKVVASDRKDNPAENALTAERVSGPLVVAHQPPAVQVKVAGMDGDEVVVEATATDPLVRLTSASFAVNGKKWLNVFPTDGLFDSKTERFRFKTGSLEKGTYVLVLRVTDAAGNTGSGDVVFTVKGE